ncbi:sensor histidine kinase [Anaerostipes butyraticus]|uniref:histidine kinase n=1 Tax=Anaerostipes butyraticus TaxID=645466 RepID=A0A916VEJ1_9FIRM|nr:HAMP domain-containing sensor histidine kinase [Anaerostipes butyraticus]GFO86811.1 two-component sensor histidine kinase [Anaerostipes butyraticus]
MKAVNKVRLIYLPAIILPIFVMIVSILALGFGYVRINNTDISADGFERFVNPLKTMNNSTKEIYRELEEKILTDPSALEDKGYLEDVNRRLSEKDSYLLLRKNQKIVYRGSKDSSQALEEKLPAYGNDESDQDRGFFVSKPGNYLVKQQDFEYQDGGKGSVFIMTDLGAVLPHYRNIIIQVCFAVVGVLILTSTFLSWFMYREFVGPIRELKAGAERIKDGNLDNDVVIRSGGEEIRELCDSFNEMRAELKDSIDARMVYEKQNRDLISNISHDLKTPITAIKGYVEGIMDGVADTPEKMDRYIKTIYNKANDMDVLINELSLYSKIDSNIIPYNFERININAYFKDCVDEIGADLEQKGMMFSYRNYCSENAMVTADPEQLKRVINNIINNACKYNNKAKGKVSITLTEFDRKIQVEIKDNGMGISKEDLPHIFRRTYRADMSRNSAGGSGLGLSICKKIIEEHGGEIWAESKLRAGTTIFFTLNKVLEKPKENKNE